MFDEWLNGFSGIIPGLSASVLFLEPALSDSPFGLLSGAPEWRLHIPVLEPRDHFRELFLDTELCSVAISFVKTGSPSWK